VIEQVAYEDVIATGERIGIDTEQCQEPGRRVLQAFAVKIGVIAQLRRRRGEFAQHRQRLAPVSQSLLPGLGLRCSMGIDALAGLSSSARFDPRRQVSRG